jgi:LCP family protein required for cell wall assembly
MKWLNSRKRIFTALIILFFATFAIGSLLGGPIKKLFSESMLEKSAKGKTINILFMGIDDRENKSNSRSDTMILASIDSKTKKIVMVSVPRDTRIKNTFGQSEKINSVNYTKGPEAACNEVAKLLNVPVDYYVVTNFAGFGKIVDILGGVDLDVETNMVHTDVSYSINLSKGYQHLNGDQALQYVRYRGGPTADIGRTQRQQKFIKALAKQMFKAKTILTLPELIPQISKNVKTNIPASDLLYLANLAKSIDTSTINAQTLPGYPYTDPSTGASYWEPDRVKAKIIIATLMQGKTFDVVGDQPAWMKQQPEKYKSQDLPTPAVLQEQAEVPITEPVTDVPVTNNGDTVQPDPTVPDGTIEELPPINPTDSQPSADSSPGDNPVTNNDSNIIVQP